MKLIILLTLLSLSVHSAPVNNITDSTEPIGYFIYNNVSIPVSENNMTKVIDQYSKVIRKPNTNDNKKIVKPIKPNPISYGNNKLHKRNVIDLNAYKFQRLNIIGPTCIPLVSKNINANPYHPKLVSRPGAQIRRGTGSYIPLPGISPMSCHGLTDCKIEITQSITITTSNTVSMSVSKSTTVGYSIGNSDTISQSSNIARSISIGIEKSISNTQTVTNEQSTSDTISNSLSSNHEKRTSSNINFNLELLSSQTRDSHTTESTDRRHSIGGGINIPIININTNHEWGTSRSDTSGSSNTHSISRSSGIGSEVSISDSLAMSFEALRSNSHSQSFQNSNTNNRADSYSVSDTNTATKENSITRSYNEDKSSSNSKENGTQNTKQLSMSISSSHSFQIKPGECKITVCKPLVSAMVIPYSCAGEDKVQNVFADVMFVDRDANNNFGCVLSAINCKDRNNPYQFVPDDDEYNNANVYSSIPYGKTLQKGGRIRSPDEQYILMHETNGNLILKQYEQEIWSSGITKFDNYQTRVRINELGHLVTEVLFINNSGDVDDEQCMGLSWFSNSDKNYKCRDNDWIVVWSTASINHNVQIGIPSAPNSRTNYKLVLSDSGELKLFDSCAAMIWCNSEDCQHNMGYKYPRMYLLPTNFETERIPNDFHNSLPPNINFIGSELKSLDTGCIYMNVNDGIRSPNKRFSAILLESGSLIIKDKYRTMWDSLSSNLKFTTSPYRLSVTKYGNIIIRDKENNIIWTTHHTSTIKDYLPPFTMKMLDSGKLVVSNANDQIVWDSWPNSNMSTMTTLLSPQQYCLTNCNECRIYNDYRQIINKANNKCLEHNVNVGNSSTANSVTLEDCDENKYQQFWYYDKNLDAFRVKNSTAICLSMNVRYKDNDNGTYIPTLEFCRPLNRYTFNNGNLCFKINGKCLNTKNGITGNTLESSNEFIWKWQNYTNLIDESNYKPLRASRGKYVHANLESMSIVIGSGGDKSMFVLSNGLLRVQAEPSYCASVDKVESDQTVVIKPCASAIQWDMTDELKPRSSDLCLTMHPSKYLDNSKLQLSKCNKSYNQKFYFQTSHQLSYDEVYNWCTKVKDKYNIERYATKITIPDNLLKKWNNYACSCVIMMNNYNMTPTLYFSNMGIEISESERINCKCRMTYYKYNIVYPDDVKKLDWRSEHHWNYYNCWDSVYPVFE